MISLQNLLNIFKKDRNSKNIAPTNEFNSALDIESDFNNIYLKPASHNIPTYIYELFNKQFQSSDRKCPKLSWSEFANDYLEIQKPYILPQKTKECIEIAESTESLKDGEGTISLNSNYDIGSDLLNYFPKIDFAKRFKVEIVILGTELEMSIFIYDNSKLINVTDKINRDGLIFSLGSSNTSRNKKLTCAPYWIYEIYRDHLANSKKWSFNNKPLIAGLQEIQDWLLENSLCDTLELKDKRFKDKKIIYLNSFDLYATKSLEAGSNSDKACLVPFSDSIKDELGYSDIDETLDTIQRSIRNWDDSKNILELDSAQGKKISLGLTNKSQKALKAVKENFFNKPEKEIIDALRYHSENSIIKKHPEFEQVFNLDINNYGRRVIGLGEPFIITGISNTNQYKSLLGEIDELDHTNTDKAKEEALTVNLNGQDAVIFNLPTQNGPSKQIHIFKDEIKDKYQDIKNARKSNHDYEIKDQKTGEVFCLDLHSQESFEFISRNLKSLIKKVDNTTHKSKESEIKKGRDALKALQIKAEYYDELSKTNKINEVFDLIEKDLGLKEEFSLFDYQEICVKWLATCFLNLYPGVLLADDMGLGKTFQSLCFMKLLREKLWDIRFDDEEIQPFLIVVPPILLDNFKEQAEIAFQEPGSFGFTVIHGSKVKDFYRTDIDINGKEIKAGYAFLDSSKLKSEKCIVTTYDVLANYEHSFAQIPWSLLLCDEVQKAKSAKTSISRVLKAVASKASFKILMSGTPIENNMFEFWNILDTCAPGVLPGSPSEFKREYPAFFSESSDLDKDKAFEKLNEEINFGDFKEGYVNGRLKEDVGKNIPDKFPIDICFDLDQETLSIIEEIKNSSLKAIEKIRKVKQVSIHKFLLEPHLEHPYHDWMNNNDRFAQLVVLLDQIKQKNEKVLVFCEYHAYQDFIQKFINNSYGSKFLAINHTVDTKARKSILNEFQTTDGFAALVLSPRCAGMGLNLQESNHVIHLTRWWNPAVEDQATCRAHRTGQKKDVYVYYFVANHHFEQTLDERLKEKRAMRKNLFDLSYTQDIETTDIISPSSPKGPKKLMSLHEIDLIKGPNTSAQGKSFEDQVKILYEQVGYKVYKTRVDRGIDWILEDQNGRKIGVQVKHVHGGNKYTDLKSIQAFPSALKQESLERGIFITNGEFIDKHYEIKKIISEDNDIEWIDREQFAQILLDAKNSTQV